MKNLLTLLLVFFVSLSFAQRGEINLESISDKIPYKMQPKQEIILPGNWADATQVGTYNWTSDDENIGWIFGNNAYGHEASGQVFNVTEPYSIQGAYFWIGSAAEGSGDVVFFIAEFNGAPGDIIASVTRDLSEVVAYPTGEGVTPDQYEQTFFVEFDSPVAITSDYIIGVDYSGLTWTAPGDGVALSSTIVGQPGGGLGLAWIRNEEGTWVLATSLNTALDLDLGIFVQTEDLDVETYTVTFNVEDENGDPIETAAITLGPFNNEEGDYVFEEVPEGTHEYSVVAMGYAGVTGEVTVDGDTQVDVVMGEAEVYTVTFVVDMTDAVAQDDIVFNPEIHDVYIAGNFPQEEWAQPGSNEVFMLTPVDNNDKQEGEMLYPGNWENASEIVLYTAEGGGYVVGTNQWEDLAKAQVFQNNEELTLSGAYFWFGAVEGSAGNVEFIVWDFNGAPGEQLSSTSVSVGDITASETLEDAFWVEFDEPVTVTSDFMVGFGLANVGDSQVGLMSSSDGDGTDLSWEQWDDGVWHTIQSAWDLSIDIGVFPVVATDDPGNGEELFYSITLQLPEAGYEYKYFLVEDEPTWDIGEWEGPPNREVTVTMDETFNDVFGQDPTVSVDEPLAETNTLVYPNPARDNINISSDEMINEIRIYDISGRMVFSNTIGDFNTVINVGSFNQGIYFMQIFGENGAQTHKIQVMK